ncbi:MAG: hypothetical protein H6765_05330 [Candidatus Peribacteria bacterium]|nr:MAG: hypothetical protein H6765_05330 [Candidatus Peribacteria bacterium]
MQEYDTELYKALERAQLVQDKRFTQQHIATNSQIHSKVFAKYIHLTAEANKFLRAYAEQYALSARVIHKLCKVARTIADMEESCEIERTHIAEAVYYRGKTMFVGG